MGEQEDPVDAQFKVMTNRLLRREALRRAAEELNTTSRPGLEDLLARISAEVTTDAIERVAALRGITTEAHLGLDARPPAVLSNHDKHPLPPAPRPRR